MTKGWFITFEGGEGAGKTFMLNKVKGYLETLGYDVVATREPGGTELAEKIRNLLIGPEVENMDAITEVLLYAAARREHFKDVIQPALNAKKIVLSDRFFDTSLVYQGLVKKGMRWDQILDINLKATNGKQPDLTIYFDIEPEKGLKRIKTNSQREVNRFDKADLEFHHAARHGYLALKACFPERIKMVDADQYPENVFDDVIEIIFNKLELPSIHTIKFNRDKSTLAVAESIITENAANHVPPNYIFQGVNQQETLKITADGEIYWKGRKIEADKELVDAFREFLISQKV